jgi:hypothetical protein
VKLDGGNDRVGIGSKVNIANAAATSFDLNGFNQEIRTLGGGGETGGTVINSGGTTSTLTMRPDGGDNGEFHGVIDGDIRVVIAGTKVTPARGHTAAATPESRQHLHRRHGRRWWQPLGPGRRLPSVPSPPASRPDNITLQNNGTLLNSEDALTVDANRGITLGTGGGALAGGWNQTNTFQGVISGAAGNDLTIVGNNANIVITGDNTYAGDTILAANNSVLRVGDGGTSGTLGTGNVSNAGSLTFNRSDASSYAGDDLGRGHRHQAGSRHPHPLRQPISTPAPRLCPAAPSVSASRSSPTSRPLPSNSPRRWTSTSPATTSSKPS